MSNAAAHQTSFQDRIQQIAPYAILVLFALWTLVPIVWMLISSLKIRTSMFTMPPDLIFDPTLRYYQELLFGANPLTKYLMNSAIVSVSSAVIAVSLGTLGGTDSRASRCPARSTSRSGSSRREWRRSRSSSSPCSSSTTSSGC
ncbi:hypothetical protein [Halospeciosus flavus]|uniref:hypothetical protein n=1 Tax=Halospeciosus flavus TaxID=3032283 RepID=UPI00361B37AC